MAVIWDRNHRPESDCLEKMDIDLEDLWGAARSERALRFSCVIQQAVAKVELFSE